MQPKSLVAENIMQNPLSRHVHTRRFCPSLEHLSRGLAPDNPNPAQNDKKAEKKVKNVFFFYLFQICDRQRQTAERKVWFVGFELKPLSFLSLSSEFRVRSAPRLPPCVDCQPFSSDVVRVGFARP